MCPALPAGHIQPLLGCSVGSSDRTPSNTHMGSILEFDDPGSIEGAPELWWGAQVLAAFTMGSGRYDSLERRVIRTTGLLLVEGDLTVRIGLGFGGGRTRGIGITGQIDIADGRKWCHGRPTTDREPADERPLARADHRCWMERPATGRSSGCRFGQVHMGPALPRIRP